MTASCTVCATARVWLVDEKVQGPGTVSRYSYYTEPDLLHAGQVSSVISAYKGRPLHSRRLRARSPKRHEWKHAARWLPQHTANHPAR